MMSTLNSDVTLGCPPPRADNLCPMMAIDKEEQERREHERKEYERRCRQEQADERREKHGPGPLGGLFD